MAINIGVVVMFVWQGWLVFKKPPDATQLKLKKKMALKLVQKGIDQNRDRILDAIGSFGFDEQQAKDIEYAVVQMLGRIPVAIAMMDEIDDIVEELQSGVFSIQESGELLEKVLRVAKKLLGKKDCVALFQPYAVSSVSMLVDSIPGPLSDEARSRAKGLGVGIAQFMVGNGFRPFMSKWIKLMEDIPKYGTSEECLCAADELFAVEVMSDGE